MSDSGDTMGSLLDSGPVVEPPDDPEDLEAPRVAIDIHPNPTEETDHEELAGKFAALLAAHAAETKKLEDRVELLEGLRLSETMVAAAASAASSASAAAQSAEAACRLIEKSEEAVATAAAVMEVAREAVKQISADGVIPELLTEHCVNAAASARDVVCSCLEDARIDAEEFVEQTRAAASTGKRSGGKKR